MYITYIKLYINKNIYVYFGSEIKTVIVYAFQL